MVDFLPTHPGELLLREFMEPLGITQYALAKAIGVPLPRINQIVHGRRSITADTALRLSRALGLSDAFWVNVQSRYDLDMARVQLGDKLDQIEKIAVGS
ncbi:MAG: HigA family addiction module antitoxin [Mycolicibacterium insubricum]|nr:HigA family addiction module antidote protein [Mycobacterium sp.]